MAKTAEAKPDIKAVTEGNSPLPQAVIPTNVGKKGDIVVALGGDRDILTALDEALAKRVSSNEDTKSQIDTTADDITRAKAIENGSAVDVVKSDIISEAAISMALRDGRPLDALAALAARRSNQASHLRLVQQRKQIELSDITMHRRQIVVGAINKFTQTLIDVLKEVGTPADKIDNIMAKLSQQSEFISEE